MKELIKGLTNKGWSLLFAINLNMFDFIIMLKKDDWLLQVDYIEGIKEFSVNKVTQKGINAFIALYDEIKKERL